MAQQRQTVLLVLLGLCVVYIGYSSVRNGSTSQPAEGVAREGPTDERALAPPPAVMLSKTQTSQIDGLLASWRQQMEVAAAGAVRSAEQTAKLEQLVARITEALQKQKGPSDDEESEKEDVYNDVPEFEDQEGMDRLLLKIKHQMNGLDHDNAALKAEAEIQHRATLEKQQEILLRGGKRDMIICANTLKCFDAPSDFEGGETPLLTDWCYYDGGTQEWSWDDRGHIRGEDGDCVDVDGLTSGAYLKVAPCKKGTLSQEFDWQRVGPRRTVGFLKHKHSNLCLESSRPKPELLTSGYKPRPILLKTCDNSCNQLWIVRGNATYFPALPKEEPKREPAGKPGRLLCWIMTNPKNHDTKAATVNRTWGRGCDELIFITSEKHATLNTFVVKTGQEEGRHYLWRKSIIAWTHLYNNFLDKADWFMRADDDTFIIMDNLKAFLKRQDPSQPRMYGRWLTSTGDFTDFFSGGAGAIISRKALQTLGDAAKKNPYKIFSKFDTFADDLELGASFAKVGLKPNDSRDEDGMERFFTLGIGEERTINRKNDPKNWYWGYSHYEAREGEDCCSKRWIASHYTAPSEMLNFDDMYHAGCEGAGNHPWYAKVAWPKP